MTLAENKKQLLAIIAEYSGTSPLSEDEEIIQNLNFLYNSAVQELSQIKPIRVVEPITRTGQGTTEYYRGFLMPTDMREVEEVLCLDLTTNKPKTPDYYIKGRYIYINDLSLGNYKLVYQAYPTMIDAATEESFELELDEDAQSILPYTVASDILKTDPSSDYKAFEIKYQNRLAILNRKESSGLISVETVTLE